MKSKAATPKQKILDFIADHPNPTIAVSRRWLASPANRQAFALICREIGFGDARKAMDWIGKSAWEALKRESSPIRRVRSPRVSVQQALAHFCDELTEESMHWPDCRRRDADPFLFLREQEPAELRSRLLEFAPEKIALIGLFRTPEEWNDEILPLLSAAHASKSSLALSKIRQEDDPLPFEAARRFASELLGRISPWQLLMASEPLPQAPTVVAAQMTEEGATQTLRTIAKDRRWSMEFELADCDRVAAVELDLPQAPSAELPAGRTPVGNARSVGNAPAFQSTTVHSEEEMLDFTACSLSEGRLIEQRILALYRDEFPELHDELQAALTYPTLAFTKGAEHGTTGNT